MKRARHRNPKGFDKPYKSYDKSYDKPYYSSWLYPRYGGYYRDYYYDPRPISATSWLIGGAIVLAAAVIVATTPPKPDVYP